MATSLARWFRPLSSTLAASLAALLLFSFAPGAVVAQSGDISDVVIFGTNSVEVKTSVAVTGDVVVNAIGPATELVIDRSSTVDGRLKANRIQVKRNAAITGVVSYNQLQLDQGATVGGQVTPLNLPVFSAPAFQTANPRANAPNVSALPGPATVLAAGQYGDITVAAGATLVFSGGLYEVRSLNAGALSTVHFSAPTDLRILGRLVVGQSSEVGPGGSSGIAASDIIIYAAATDGPAGVAAIIGKDTDVAANLYAGNGTLTLDQVGLATGAFLGVTVIVNKNSTVVLDSYFDRPPTADPQSVETSGSDPLEIILTGNDPDGGDLTFATSALASPALGTLSAPVPIVPDTFGRCELSGDTCEVNADCPGTGETCLLQTSPITSASVTYTPATNENLENSFTFTVTDPEGDESAPALVQINVPEDPTNPPVPTAVNVADANVETPKDTPVEIPLEGEAPPGVSLTFSIVSGPTNGSLSGLADVPPVQATVTYTPNTGTTGVDSFVFKACNTLDSGDCDTATATINVFAPSVPEPDPDTVTLADQTVVTPENTPVLISLTAETSTSSASQQRSAGKAETMIGATVAGNVADCEPIVAAECAPNGLGDNHNNLPGPTPVLMSAGVGQGTTGGDGSRGTPRMQFEWDISNLSASELENATVLLYTSKGTVDILDTKFFAGAADQDGLLTDSDFEAPVDTALLATMPVVAGNSTFQFNVLPQLLAALGAERSFFSVQGRVNENLTGPQRGLQVRTTATNNLTGAVCPNGLSNCEPQLVINGEGPPLPPGAVFAVFLEVITLPAFGTLIDENGRTLPTSTPLLNGAKLVYTPISGIYSDNFQVKATLKETTSNTIINTITSLMTVNVGSPSARPSVEMRNHPNPFNPNTTIIFAVPEASPVKLVVYDVLGRQVRVLVDGPYEAGAHKVTFDASDLPSGMYLYRLDTSTGSSVKSMLLVK